MQSATLGSHSSLAPFVQSLLHFSGILLQGSPSYRLPFLFGGRRSPPNLSAPGRGAMTLFFNVGRT